MMDAEEIREIVRNTVKETLIAIGIDTSTPESVKRLQRDMDWLDTRVTLEERISGKIIISVAVAAVGGLLSLVVVGFKTLLNIH